MPASEIAATWPATHVAFVAKAQQVMAFNGQRRLGKANCRGNGNERIWHASAGEKCGKIAWATFS